MEKLKTIKSNGKSYPYKMDLFVLEKLQEQWHDITTFERALKGFRLALDENGHQKYKDGEPLVERVHFDIKAINTALPLMVNEGLEIEADAKHTEYVPVDEKEFIRGLQINPYKLQELVSAEFDKCFEIKK